jgi:hypothetical protein
LGVLQYSTYFPNAGVFVAMIENMVRDMATWFCVFTVFWVGFSASFYVVLQRYANGSNGYVNPECLKCNGYSPFGSSGRAIGRGMCPQMGDKGTCIDDYDSFYTTVITMFRAMLGDWDYTYEQYQEWALLQFLFCIFTTIVLVLLLNMLIAMMGESYKSLKDESRAAGMIKQLLQIGRLREICYNHSHTVPLPDFYTPLRTNLSKALRKGKLKRVNERRNLKGTSGGATSETNASAAMLVVESWEPLAEIHHYTLDDLAKSITRAAASDSSDDDGQGMKKRSCKLSCHCVYYQLLRPMFYTVLSGFPHVLLSWFTNLRGKYMHNKQGLLLRCRESRGVIEASPAFTSNLADADEDEASMSFREITLSKIDKLRKVEQGHKEEITGQISKAVGGVADEVDSLQQKMDTSNDRVKGIEAQQALLLDTVTKMLAMMTQQQEQLNELTAGLHAKSRMDAEARCNRREIIPQDGKLGIGLGKGKTAKGHEVTFVSEEQRRASGLVVGEVIERVGMEDVRALAHDGFIAHVQAQVKGSGTLVLWVART